MGAGSGAIIPTHPDTTRTIMHACRACVCRAPIQVLRALAELFGRRVGPILGVAPAGGMAAAAEAAAAAAAAKQRAAADEARSLAQLGGAQGEGEGEGSAGHEEKGGVV